VAAAYKLFRHLLDPDLDCFQDQISKNWASKDLESTDIIWEDCAKSEQPVSCPMIDNHLIILADGSVCACCWDYNFLVFGKPLGNVCEEPLLSVFNGANFSQLRAILNNGASHHLPAKCLSCYFLYSRNEPSAEEAAIDDPRLITICEGSYVYAFRNNNIINRLWGRIKRSGIFAPLP
jgi:hypothetical protein